MADFSGFDLLELRDKTIPELASQERFADIKTLLDRMWDTMLTTEIQFEDKRLRDETVLIMLWMECLISNVVPPAKLSHTARDVAIAVDVELEEEDVTNWMKLWCLTNGSQMYLYEVSLALGRQLAHRANERIAGYAVKVHTPTDPDNVVCQMATFFQRAADLNTYERTSDTFMFETLRTYLSCSRQATLASFEGPMKILPKQFEQTAEDPTNSIVRPLVENNATEMLNGVAWKTVSNPNIFILLSVLLREQCDALPLQIFSNTNITYHECSRLRDVPQLFVITKPNVRDEIVQFGIIFKRVFHVFQHRTPNHMLHTFLLYIRMCHEETSKCLNYAETSASLGQLLEAVVDFDRIQVTNPFCKMIKTVA